jgi:hypothetical protein
MHYKRGSQLCVAAIMTLQVCWRMLTYADVC